MDCAKDTRKFSEPMISRKLIKNFVWKFEKSSSFSNEKKMASRKIFWLFLHANRFMFIFLITNHTVFLVQFRITLDLRVFQEAEIAISEATCEPHSCKLIPN